MEISEEKVRLYIELKQKCDEILKTFWTEEPRKHGHLIKFDTYYDCSVCGKGNEYGFDYCPWCGAKMDEETEQK